MILKESSDAVALHFYTELFALYKCLIIKMIALPNCRA